MYKRIVAGNSCTGCGACEASCVKKAISMQFNKEGFLYPVINSALCVDCGKCIKSCQIYETVALHKNECCLAVVSRNADETKSSSSGGFFYTLAKKFVSENGVVCGAVFCEDKLVRHVCADTLEGIKPMQGSKYVQSSTVDCYKMVQKYLMDGRKVLFAGTPCQIAGLYSCVGAHELLWTVDIVCHGVPSPLLLKDHIEKREAEYKKTAEKVYFRHKDIRNRTSFRLQLTENNECWYDRYYKNDIYYSLFMEGISYRESCYSCAFAQNQRVGDITMGDLGSFRDYPHFHFYEATSTVLLNTEKGCRLWETVKEEFDYQEISFEREQQLNHQLNRPTKRPDCRDYVYDEVMQLSEKEIQNKYCPAVTVREQLSLTIKQYLPIWLINWIRRYK